MKKIIVITTLLMVTLMCLMLIMPLNVAAQQTHDEMFVSAGFGHTVGLKSDGTVIACGEDSSGQVSGVDTWTDITQVSAGFMHTVGLRNDGTVVACGDDGDGQVSDVNTWTDIVQVSAGFMHTVGLRNDGTVVACGHSPFSDAVDPVNSWTDIVQVSAGMVNTVGLKNDGTVIACGSDSSGQVSGVNAWANIEQISILGHFVVGLKNNGTVAAAGWSYSGQKGCVEKWNDIEQVSSGLHHTVGLKSDGTVVACGDDSNGQISGVNAWTNIVQVAAGEKHTVGLKNDGTVVACGSNENGQIGGVGNWSGIMMPSIMTDCATDIELYSATFNGTLYNMGTASTVAVSFEYGTLSGSYPYSAVAVESPMNGTGSFHADIGALISNTRYYCKAKGIGAGIDYGNEISFSTLKTEVSTVTATNVGTSSATLNGTLDFSGTSVAVSFEYGTQSGSYPYSIIAIESPMNGTGAFHSNIGDLIPDTVYYYRAKGVGIGTDYGDELSFTTLKTEVSTVAAINVGTSTATLNGNLDFSGASVIVSFEYGTQSGSYPYSVIAVESPMNGPGSFHSNIGSLLFDTTYYYRAKAIGAGTDYANELSFTTLKTEVSTLAATNTGTFTATLNGTLEYLGVSSVDVSFEYGIEPGSYPYSTVAVENPMNGTGTFHADISGLPNGKIYYFRAKGVGVGIDYGKESNFTTFNIPETIYVNSIATGIKDGNSWETAYLNIDTALDRSYNGDKIWIASGTYTPTVAHGGTNSRYQSYQMKDGVGIYGGFPNTGSPTWEQRDWETYQTILSGEIGDPGTITDNCYHVFFHTEDIILDNTAILDGFIIKEGNADGTRYHDNTGGGMFLSLISSPTITNCVFRDNYADYGGGIYTTTFCLPVISNCTFRDNQASFLGGGICASASITNCTFTHNKTIDSDGGGGGIFGSGLIVTNCIFTKNATSGHLGGGGITTGFFDPVEITNSIFWCNSANKGRSISGYLYNNKPTVINCIIWGNPTDEVIQANVTYSDIHGGYWGTGNISGTPMFINPGSGDFHLLPNSPCIDSGSNVAIQATGIVVDFEGDNRIINGTVDMGVDEVVGWSPIVYDADLDGNISKQEALNAVVDFFAGLITKQQALEVIVLFFN